MSVIITASDLTIEREGRIVLSPSTFEVEKGAIVAVIGPNGSGKSTLLDAMAGLLPASSGTITLWGQKPEDARSRVSYVLQHLSVTPGIPLTVREAVTMGRYAQLGLFSRLGSRDRQQVEQALAELGISDLASRHLDKLSGGQRQRVFVAQALAQDHDLLLLDEPLTGLDIPSAKIIDQVIHREPGVGCTVVFTTHDLEEARAADQVLLLSGRVVASGPPEEVLTPAHLAEAYGLGVLHPEHTHGDFGAEALLDPGHEPLDSDHPRAF